MGKKKHTTYYEMANSLVDDVPWPEQQRLIAAFKATVITNPGEDLESIMKKFVEWYKGRPIKLNPWEKKSKKKAWDANLNLRDLDIWEPKLTPDYTNAANAVVSDLNQAMFNVNPNPYHYVNITSNTAISFTWESNTNNDPNGSEGEPMEAGESAHKDVTLEKILECIKGDGEEVRKFKEIINCLWVGYSKNVVGPYYISDNQDQCLLTRTQKLYSAKLKTNTKIFVVLEMLLKWKKHPDFTIIDFTCSLLNSQNGHVSLMYHKGNWGFEFGAAQGGTFAYKPGTNIKDFIKHLLTDPDLQADRKKWLQTFDRCVLPDEARAQIEEALTVVLNTKKFDEWGIHESFEKGITNSILLFGPPGCLVNDTLIATSEGPKCIQDVQDVISLTSTGETVIMPAIVLKTHKKKWKVKLDDDSTIEASGAHPWFITETETIQTKDLKVGTSIIIADQKDIIPGWSKESSMDRARQRKNPEMVPKKHDEYGTNWEAIKGVTCNDLIATEKTWHRAKILQTTSGDSNENAGNARAASETNEREEQPPVSTWRPGRTEEESVLILKDRETDKALAMFDVQGYQQNLQKRLGGASQGWEQQKQLSEQLGSPVYIVSRKTSLQTRRVCLVEETSEEVEMFDLIVPETNNFFLANGVLSHNTGKSMVGESIAAVLDKHLLKIDSSHIQSQVPGEAERNIKEFFAQAKKENAVLMLDECDSLLYNRDFVGPILSAEINVLLQEIERFDGVCLLTTNRLGHLDPALQRRVISKIRLDPPNKAARKQIWQNLMPEKMPKGEIDYDQLKRYNLTGGEIKNAILLAARTAIAKCVERVEMEHLEIAVKNVWQAKIDFEEANETMQSRNAHHVVANGGSLSEGVDGNLQKVKAASTDMRVPEITSAGVDITPKPSLLQRLGKKAAPKLLSEAV